MSERTHREGISSNPKDRIGATKVPLSLIPLAAQINAALAHFDGSLKYGPFNWRGESVAATIYIDAALRHILKYFEGETHDADSGVHHLGHAVACLNIIMDAEVVDNLIDDRPITSNAAAILDHAREEVIRLIKLRGKDVPATPTLVEVDNEITARPRPPLTIGEASEIAQNTFLANFRNNEGFEETSTEECSEEQIEKAAEYYGFDIISAVNPQDSPTQEHAKKKHAIAQHGPNNPAGSDKIVSDARVTKTEALAGHMVQTIDEKTGYIDGEYLQGTAFKSRVKLYRDGFQNIDEAMEAQYAKERELQKVDPTAVDPGL